MNRAVIGLLHQGVYGSDEISATLITKDQRLWASEGESETPAYICLRHPMTESAATVTWS